MPAVILALVLVVSALGSVIVPRFSEPTPYYSSEFPTEGETE
ncbi:hypothetical protein AB0A60_25545 [Streptomyces sp. NPDC046275]